MGPGRAASSAPASAGAVLAPVPCLAERPRWEGANACPPPHAVTAHWGLELDGLDFFENLVSETLVVSRTATAQ